MRNSATDKAHTHTHNKHTRHSMVGAYKYLSHVPINLKCITFPILFFIFFYFLGRHAITSLFATVLMSQETVCVTLQSQITFSYIISFATCFVAFDRFLCCQYACIVATVSHEIQSNRLNAQISLTTTQPMHMLAKWATDLVSRAFLRTCFHRINWFLNIISVDTCCDVRKIASNVCGIS